jgi:hypothetical protein
MAIIAQKQVKFSGLYITLNTLLGLNDLTYSFITYRYATIFTGLC